MLPKVAAIVPIRNKAFYVENTIQSTLDQTHDNLEILLSDQGSTDNSLEIMHKMADAYDGPHNVRVLECPDTEPTGIAGLNAHIDWLMTQTDADLIMVVSADDLNHPNRAKRLAEVWEEYRPSFIGTKMQFLQPDGTLEGLTAFNPEGSRFITAREHLEGLVGGSVSTAFDREFYDKIGGLHGHTIPDMYLPFLAALDRGFYMIDEQLFAYVRHSSDDNAGLGGQMLAAEGSDAKLQINELSNYQIISTLYQAGRAAVINFPENWEDSDACQALFMNIVHRGNDWVMCRDILNQRKMQPRVL